MKHAIARFLSIFGFFQNLKMKLERELVRLHHFLSLSQIPKLVILEVTIKVDQGTSTFGMHGSLRVKD